MNDTTDKAMEEAHTLISDGVNPTVETVMVETIKTDEEPEVSFSQTKADIGEDNEETVVL